MDWRFVKPSPPPRVPGNTEAERMDNAVRKMFSVSKEDVLKQEAKGKRLREKKREEAARLTPRAAPSTRVYLGFLAARSDFRMIRTKRATINPNSHGPRDKGKLMNPNIAF